MTNRSTQGRVPRPAKQLVPGVVVQSALGRAPRMDDVATLAGVSLGTVSNVLNRPHRVTAANVARVQDAMAQLGFVRNESARHLRAGRSSTVGYVMLDATNPFFTDVSSGIESTAEAESLSLFLCNSSNRAEREVAHLERLREMRVAGILVTPLDPSAGHLAEIAASVPLVVVGARTSHEICSVSVDDVLGGQLAIQHLVDLGHERAAFVGGPSDLTQVKDRIEGARQAWREAGLDGANLTVLGTEGLDVDQGRAAGERLAGLPKRRRPTAVFCANDLLALGMLQHAIATGCQVPGDLAIVGYDDIDFARAAAIPVTSVSQPRAELGRAAGRLLIEESNTSGHVHHNQVFKPELVARQSTL